MWSTTLTPSLLHFLSSTTFYLLLMITCLVQLAHTSLNCYTFIFIFILIIEWWRTICYFKTIKGEFTLFDVTHQIYWHKQRWYLMRKPLMLRYIMIINLKSRHDGKRRVLFLMIDNLEPNDWRTLRYHLKNIDLSK
jgi:uncharacterized membrane protein